MLKRYQRRLNVLEEQEAQFGLSVPPHIVTEIADLRLKIEQLRSEL